MTWLIKVMGAARYGKLVAWFGGTQFWLTMLLMAFLVGGFVGWKVTSTIEKAASVNALMDAIKDRDESIARIESHYERLLDLNNASYQQLEAKLAKLRQSERTIIKEVPVYVQSNPDCDLTVGAVGLLNSARAGVSGGGAPEAGAAGTPDAEKLSPSIVTQRAEVEAHADCAIRYNELAEKHDALIEWIRTYEKGNK